MKNPFTTRREARPAPQLAWCERVTASPTSPDHLRAVPAGEDLVLGGGLRATALCGTSMDRGWDLRFLRGIDELRARLANEHPTNRVCPACARAAATHLGEDVATGDEVTP